MISIFDENILICKVYGVRLETNFVQEEFGAAKNELKKTIEKKFTPTQDNAGKEGKR
jgi:hypothetical protein